MSTGLAYAGTLFAILATAWQAWRGYALQAESCQYKEMAEQKPFRAALLYPLADGFTHFVLALAGWWSIWASADALLQIRAAAEPSTSGVAYAFALGLFGLLGTTGQVPAILRIKSA
jgi:hypothetical protein